MPGRSLWTPSTLLVSAAGAGRAESAQWHGSVDCKGDERAAGTKLRRGPPWAGWQVEIKLFPPQ